MVKDVAFNEATGVFTITYLNGATITLDTKLEKLAVNFDYDPETQQLIIILDDETEQYVDLSALITVYEFLDSDTIAFSVDDAGKVSAIVKEGSIEEKHLQPNYLADIKVEVAKAESAVESTEELADLAKSYAVGTDGAVREGDSTDNAKNYYERTKGIAEGIEGAFFPMGTIEFSQLESVDKEPGYMYNIKDEFVTDDRFKEGAGCTYPAGTNIYWTADGYWDCLAGSLNSILDMVYPVGAIYMSVNNVSPANFLGGTWERIKDRFLLSSGDSYAAGNTGGEATHALSAAEMPAHGHSYSGTTGNESAGHTHGFSATTGGQSASHIHFFSAHTGTESAAHSHSGVANANGQHGHDLYVRKDNTTGGSTYRIGTAATNNGTQTSNMVDSGLHEHALTTNGQNTAHIHTVSGETGAASGDHTHGVSGTTSDRSTVHTHGFSGTTGNTGSGNAHNNMPPYLVVYMWQRIA